MALSRGPDDGPSPFQGGQPWSSDLVRGSEPVVAVAGRGGLPIKVTSPGHGQHGQLLELWATLPRDADLTEAESSSVQAAVAPGDGPLAIAMDRPATDSFDCPNYLKAACGLLVGVSLTAGPLLPDLVSSIPRRISGWIMALRPSVPRPDRSALRNSKPRPSRSGLRGLFVRN